jgi:hypothetical protein
MLPERATFNRHYAKVKKTVSTWPRIINMYANYTLNAFSAFSVLNISLLSFALLM